MILSKPSVLRHIVGCSSVWGLLTLAGLVALGKVEEKSSFGLTALIAIVGQVVIRYSEWAYGRHDEKKDE